MGKQIFNIKGMMKDISPSKISNEFATDIQNMRLTTTDEGQYLSLTSEKGNRMISITYHSDVTGYAISSDDVILKYCTLDKYLILFVWRSNSVNMIYRFHFTGYDLTGQPQMYALRLYTGNLGFEIGMEIDTKQIYENEAIQKVYWVDGVHQPRVINIIADDDTISSWQDASYIPFDYFPAMKLNESVKIEKVPIYGLFNAGVIQYVFSYYNKRSSESQAFHTSPIFYINPGDRGGSPEETVNKSFKIKVYNPDTNFQFLRIYSVFRSSLNGTVVCKKVADLEVGDTVTNTIAGTENRREFITSDFSGTITMNHPSIEIHPLHGTIDRNNQVHYTWTDSEIKNPAEFLTSVNGNIRTYTIRYNMMGNMQAITVLSGHEVILHTGMIVDGEEIVKRFRGTNGGGLSLHTDITVKETLHSDGTFTYTFKQGTTSLSGTIGTITSTEESTSETDGPFLEYIDNGIGGEVVDASHILWLGTGRDIIPRTLEEKSNTLFFGNYKIKNENLNESDMDTIKNGCTITFNYGKEIEKGAIGSTYMYNNQLSYNQEEITGFKGGEYYSFGIVLQNGKGVWTPVIPISTVQNLKYPLDNITRFSPVKAQLAFNASARAILNRFKRVKVVVRDKFNTILGQGVVSPTVFNKSRFTGDLYAMSSWYFRDVLSNEPEDYRPQSRHHYNIKNAEYHPAVGGDSAVGNFHFYGEIFGASYDDVVYETLLEENEFNDCDFFVDWNTLTFHSPDIVYGSYSALENINMRIVGIVPITAGQTDMNITLNTATELESQEYVQFYDENFSYQEKNFTNLSQEAVKIDLNMYAYQGVNRYSHYPIYTWHRLGSLSNQEQPTGTDNWYGELNTKYMQSLRQSAYTIFLNNSLPSTYDYELKNIGFFREGDSIIKLGNKLYQGNVNMLPQAFKYKMSYTGTSPYKHDYIDGNGNHLYYGVALSNEEIPIKYKSSPHIVAELADDLILPNVHYPDLWYRFPSYFQPFQALNISGMAPQAKQFFTELDDGTIPLYTPSNADISTRARTFLTIKAVITESELSEHFTQTPYSDGTDIGHYSYVLKQDESGSTVHQTWVNSKPTLQQYDLVAVLPDQESQDETDYPVEVRIITSYIGGGGWGALGTLSMLPTETAQMTGYKQPGTYSWQNKSYPGNTPSAALSLGEGGLANALFKMQLVEGYGYYEVYLIYSDPVQNIRKYFTLYYGSACGSFNGNYFLNAIDSSNNYILHTKGYMLHTSKQYSFNHRSSIMSSFTTPYLYLVDFYHNYPNTPNLTDEQPIWKTASVSLPISNTLKADIGDTYYQRFDCMKTFPYSETDINQVAEIFSFMCETRINIDGRYDTWRGVLDSSINGETYKLNEVYSQEDNLYTHHYLADDYVDDFSNQITWTLTKVFGEDVDSWTHLTLLSTLDVSGSFGQITKLINWNDNLLCIQEGGFSKIHYKEKTALSTTNGVPVELGNSEKVDGYTYISQFAGTSKLKTVEITKTGVYFVDHHTREVYLFNGNLQSISKLKGMNTYFHSTDISEMHIDYDADLQCVYFITPTKCLCFDEQIMQFTSFFSYENAGLVNLKDKFIAIKNVNGGLIWEQFSGDYNKFFTAWKPFGLTVVSNENPTTDKTFTNIEFRADSYNHLGTRQDFITFDSLTAEDEYQNASSTLVNNVNLRKKFRIWRADIPRVSVLQRMRNTWASIGLYMSDRQDSNESLVNADIGKTTLHDLVVYYV